MEDQILNKKALICCLRFFARLKTDFYTSLTEKALKGIKQLAVLIDPDSLHSEADLLKLITLCNNSKVDIILVGGSLITNGFWDTCIIIKANTNIPVVSSRVIWSPNTQRQMLFYS